MNNLSNKICVPNSTEDLTEVIDADADAEAISNDEAKQNDYTNFNEKKATCETNEIHNSHAFL